MKTVDRRDKDELGLTGRKRVRLVRVVLGVLEKSLRLSKRPLEDFGIVTPLREANVIEKERASAAMGGNVVDDAVRGSGKRVNGNRIALLEPQRNGGFELALGCIARSCAANSLELIGRKSSSRTALRWKGPCKSGKRSGSGPTNDVPKLSERK
jgi:hypothetical protein